MTSPKSIAALNEHSLAHAVAELCAQHAGFKAVVDTHGLPSLRAAPGGLEGLLLIVTEQFLSLAAAQAIWLRLAARLQPFDPCIILACPQEELVGLGLSRAKAKSFHGLAEAVLAGTFDPAALISLDDAAARKALITLPGVGPWTADIYMLSCLQRPDAWPWGDLALQLAAQHLFDLPERPERAAMQALGERFSPWRAVAARLLWSHYRGLKRLKQA